MGKKIFAMSKVYDLSIKTVSEVEDEIQKDLDQFANGGIRVKLKAISDKTIEVSLLRKFMNYDWLNNDPKYIYNIDANIITGHTYNGFRVPVFWGCVPYDYSFHFPKKEFTKCYKESAVVLGADKPEKVEVKELPDKVVMRLTF